MSVYVSAFIGRHVGLQRGRGLVATAAMLSVGLATLTAFGLCAATGVSYNATVSIAAALEVKVLLVVELTQQFCSCSMCMLEAIFVIMGVGACLSDLHSSTKFESWHSSRSFAQA